MSSLCDARFFHAGTRNGKKGSGNCCGRKVNNCAVVWGSFQSDVRIELSDILSQSLQTKFQSFQVKSFRMTDLNVTKLPRKPLTRSFKLMRFVLSQTIRNWSFLLQRFLWSLLMPLRNRLNFSRFTKSPFRSRLARKCVERHRQEGPRYRNRFSSLIHFEVKMAKNLFVSKRILSNPHQTRQHQPRNCLGRPLFGIPSVARSAIR